MPLEELPTDFPIYSFSTAQDFEDFLEREHANLDGFYLKFAKKASGIPSVTKEEATDAVLCFGWIDGVTGRSVDKDWWLVRYTPRRKKSMWSKKNVDSVYRLQAEGRIRTTGLAAVEAAKADGRWDRAYAGTATITVPDDFAEALDLEPTARAFFNTLNKSGRYSVLWRIQTATPSARTRRIKAMTDMMRVGRVPGATDQTKEKSNRSSISRKPGTTSGRDRPRKSLHHTSGGQEICDERSKPQPEIRPRREGLRQRKP